MWLFYLRFDDRGHVQTYHIRTYNKATAAELITKAEHHGLMSTAKLVEYAAFIVSGTIKLKPMTTRLGGRSEQPHLTRMLATSSPLKA